VGLLKDFFGNSKDEIWGQIAKEIKGEYVDAGFWGKDTLVFRHREWELLLDTFTRKSGKSSTTFTRLRVPFINKDNFYFEIYREGFFSAIGKFFGMQDIQVNNAYFDENFLIKGNDEAKIKQFLDDDNLQSLFHKQPNVHILVKDDEGWFGQEYPDGVDVLYFESVGLIKNREELLNLFLLFATILDRLVFIDSAYKDDPKIKIR